MLAHVGDGAGLEEHVEAERGLHGFEGRKAEGHDAVGLQSGEQAGDDRAAAGRADLERLLADTAPALTAMVSVITSKGMEVSPSR
jgi:hypothetical protein